MAHTRIVTAALATAALGLFVAGPGQLTPKAADTAVTFTENVAPILYKNCTSCHRPGEAAPFALMNYQDARPRARQIANAVKAKQMPPWKAEHGDFAFKGDRRLTDAQITLLERWADAGAPEGDPSKMPALPKFTEGWQLGQPNLVVQMPEAYQVPATGRDIYRNFVIPLNLDHDVWVKGIDFRPSDRASVHHSLFSVDATGQARRMDDADPGPGYSAGMGGGAGLGNGGLGALLRGEQPQPAPAARGRAVNANPAAAGRATGGSLGGWAPGAQARMLPDDLAYFVPKGSDLVLATHFHPSGKPGSEASTVGLYFTDTAPSKGFTGIQLPPIFGLLANINIPAGETNYTISDSFTIPIDVKAFGIAGHAHYLAKTMKMIATLPNGETKTLITINDWDFGWQEQYQFDSYVTLPKGTKLDVTIGYDNSAANKRNPSSPPKRVTWGEQSTDEMGSVSLIVVAANRGELPVLQQAIQEHVRLAATSRGGATSLLLQGLGRGAAQR
jgi:hypothetical protein